MTRVPLAAALAFSLNLSAVALADPLPLAGAWVGELVAGRFEGQVADGGSRIEGRWIGRAGELPLTLVRSHGGGCSAR